MGRAALVLVAWACVSSGAVADGKGGALPDPSLLDGVLAKVVVEDDAAVDYGKLVGDKKLRDKLDRYLKQAATMPKDAPMAVWINVYNAAVIAQVLEHGVPESVRKVPGFFDQHTWMVAGREETLDGIEHGVLRTRFRDARIHV
ncbi:MAG: DUF547 domain-containing protein, partial [Myxococcales bacterium]|nr:DUF547 domain-containing protein [Myxococcales bacterium]